MTFAVASARIVLVAALLSTGVTPASTQNAITGESMAAIRSWVDAVKAHTPGRADDAVVKTASLSYEERETLNAGMEIFLAALLARNYNTGGSAAAKAIVDIGHSAGDPSAVAFLKQAAVFHADVAAYGDLHPTPAVGGPKPAAELRIGPGNTKIASNASPPPLLTTSRIALNRDGELLGETAASWNWPFARSLVDLIAVRSASNGARATSSDPFVGAWYHATSAAMFANGAYGDLTPHLRRAEAVLPNDARLLFDRGCYAELLGLPMHQALLTDRDVANQRARRSQTDSPLTWAPTDPRLIRIPLAEQTNADAERLYRRALAIDSSQLEAQVRLARLLEVRGRHVDAANELGLALAANPGLDVGYYAHLFAGRAARATGRVQDAAREYEVAVKLFPGAQSALLGRSQAALAESDVPSALAAIDQLTARAAEPSADPWWQYHLCAGRDADVLLRDLWATVPR